MFLFVCSLYLPANAQLTHRQQEKRVAGISFLEVPDVMTSGNKPLTGMSALTDMSVNQI